MSVNSSGVNERRANKGRFRRLLPWGRGARDPSHAPVNASLPVAAGSQSESSSAEAQIAPLKARLQQWLSDRTVPLDAVKQTLIETVLSVVGVQEELQTRKRDVEELIVHVSWVTEQILAKIQGESVPDDATKDVMDALSKTVSDIKQFLKTERTFAEYLGTQRTERLAQFRQQLDTLQIQFLEVRVIYFSQQDAGLYAGQVPSNLPLVEIPPAPTMFYGRKPLVESLIQLLLRETTCRIPLLDQAKFGENIIFLSCENLVSAEGIISVLAAYFKLPKDSRTLSAVLARLSALDCVLLVLDNLETPLETSNSHGVEQFLGHVVEVSCLSLMITMRGTTPPDCVLWEKAYSHPLDRLPLEAGLQIWRSIAGNEDAKLAELLTRLDGLPLAIRLMASQAQLTHMTPTQLLGAYEKEATRLLKRRGGGRLKSLDVSIQLSLECKSMAEETNALRLLSVLSLLPDGVPLDALPAMVPSVMYTIITCGSVLLQVALAFEENGRLRVLSPIRDFILAKYPPQGSFLEETENYFMTLMREYGTGAKSRKQGVELISADVGNMRSILIHFWKTADGSKNVEERLDVTLRVSQFSYLSSYGDCVPMLAMAEVALQAMGHRLGMAECTLSLGDALYMQHRYAEAKEKMSEAKVAFEAIGNVHGTARCTKSLGNVLYIQDRYEEATDTLREAKAGFEAIRDVLGTAQCTQTLGDVLFNQNRYEEATDTLKEAKAGFEAIGNVHGMAECTLSLGDVLYMQNRYEEAADKLREAKAGFKAIGDVRGTAQCTQSLGKNRYEEATDTLREAKAALEAIGNVHGMARCTLSLGDVLYMQNRYEEAADKLREANSAFEGIRDVLSTAQCTQSLGKVLLSQNRYEEATDTLREAKATFEAIGNVRGTAQCTQSLGDVLYMQDRYEDATDTLREAKAGFEAIGDVLGTAHCRRRLADVLLSQSRHEEAAEELSEAKKTFEAIGDPYGTAQCTQILGEVLRSQSRYEEAADRLRESKAAFETIGDRLGQAWCAKSLGVALHQQGHHDEAVGTLNLGMEIFESIGNPRGTAECNRCLGEVLCSEGHYEAAMERLTNAKAVFEAIGERLGAADCVGGLGDVLCAKKHYEAATERLREAREIFIDIGSRADAAQCSRSLAEVFSAQDRHVEAEAMLIEARDIYDEIKLLKRVEECTEALARLRSKMGEGNDVGAQDGMGGRYEVRTRLTVPHDQINACNEAIRIPQ
ncbi:TPR-like protein, partial [Calocera viscosa TUFC12733]